MECFSTFKLYIKIRISIRKFFDQENLINKNISFQKTSKKLEVTNLESNTTTIYPSIGSAARDLSCYQASISSYLKSNRDKPFKGKYKFKLIQTSFILY